MIQLNKVYIFQSTMPHKYLIKVKHIAPDFITIYMKKFPNRFQF